MRSSSLAAPRLDSRCPWIAFLTLALGQACSGPAVAVVESAETGRPLALQLQSLTGARDGGTLHAVVHLTGEAGDLRLTTTFQLGVPTILTSGSYQGRISNESVAGAVLAKSVTFLGGQSDRPSLGASFSLLDDDGTERYRLRLPTTPVERGGKPQTGGGG